MSLKAHLLSGLVFGILALASPQSGQAHDDAGKAMYLANEGVMVQKGDVKILFDPLYNQNFNTYLLVPEKMRSAIMTGTPPFDGIDIVFISHAHGDHFAAKPMLDFMRSHPDTQLVASTQAVEALKAVATDKDTAMFARVNALSLGPNDPPLQFDIQGVTVEAVRIPHAGGPGRASVQNYALRIGLDKDTRVLHLGDADPDLRYFAPLNAHWQAKKTQLAMPPYWFFLSPEGRQIMDKYLNADHYTGVHVPADAQSLRQQYADALADADLFTTPGETRDLD